MRSLRTSGSVGRAPGNRCLYPESDGLQPTLLTSLRLSAAPDAWRSGKRRDKPAQW
jgi:hypothetical protein